MTSWTISWNESIFPMFLNSIKRWSDCSNYTPIQLESIMSDLARVAIKKFKFPRISTAYEYTVNDYGYRKYYFCDQNITDDELAVIVAYMKYGWLNFQLSNDYNFENFYTDKNIKTFSSANLNNSILNLVEAARKEALRIEQDYYAVRDYTPTIGDMYD